MSDVYASLSGARISKCELAIPYYGLWVADVELPTEAPIPSPCTLVIADLSLVGSVARTDSFAGLRTARLVGGFGGWSKSPAYQEYMGVGGVQMSLILGDVAAAVGERVNVANDASVGSFFFREFAPASRLLRQLSGGLWWAGADGTTQVGVSRSTLPITTSFLIEEFDPSTGRILASTESPGDWMPGRTVSNATLKTPRTLSLVRHILDNEGKLRTEAVAA